MLLMDDTVILAMSKERCVEEINVLIDLCPEKGMKLNTKKTKFIVMSGTAEDREPLKTNSVSIEYTPESVYLGADFDDTVEQSNLIRNYARKLYKHANKLAIFYAKKISIPFYLKKKILEVALVSSIVYSSESWLTSNMKEIRAVYHKSLKLLLGFRIMVSNLLCRIEARMPSLSAMLTDRRVHFLRKFLCNASDEEPSSQVWGICTATNTPGIRLFLGEQEKSEKSIEADMDSLHIDSSVTAWYYIG